ncbi:MAG TPA: hypothetical protein VFZ78_04300 [Flavisolibacter sp.]
MQRATRFMFILLRNTFLLALASVIIGWIGGIQNVVTGAIGIFGFYCTLLLIPLFSVHFVLVILTFISRDSSRENNK